MRPLVESKRCPARTAIVRGAGAHLYTPPSVPTQGVGPAPRHGVWGAWAETETARLTPSAAAVITYRTTSLLQELPLSKSSTTEDTEALFALMTSRTVSRAKTSCPSWPSCLREKQASN